MIKVKIIVMNIDTCFNILDPLNLFWALHGGLETYPVFAWNGSLGERRRTQLAKRLVSYWPSGLVVASTASGVRRSVYQWWPRSLCRNALEIGSFYAFWEIKHKGGLGDGTTSKYPVDQSTEQKNYPSPLRQRSQKPSVQILNYRRRTVYV